MKKKILLFLFVPLALSCGRLSSKGEGELRISFSSLFYDVTRSVEEIPDTSDFILEITDSEGNFIYDGLYGDSPESVTVPCNKRPVAVTGFVYPIFLKGM